MKKLGRDNEYPRRTIISVHALTQGERPDSHQALFDVFAKLEHVASLAKTPPYIDSHIPATSEIGVN